jgi:tetratricopeptide (TPR) repeat protein
MPDQFGELRVGPDEPEHRAVLRSYVVKRLARPRPDGQGPLPADWAGPLIDQAGGSFLYVFHYCRALHFGVYTDLAQLPPPVAYYPAFFEHLRGRVGDELFKGHYARALAFIAVAREPVGLTHLEAWGLKRSDLVMILDDLADLLRTRREPWDAETLYSLGHDAIRQFLTEDTYWQSRLARANSDLAKQAVRRFGNDWSAVDPFDPVESYLLFHLLDHATEPKLRERLMADTALADACQRHGSALWEKRDFVPCLLAYDMAVRLREDQIQRQGRAELRNDLAEAYVNRGLSLMNVGRLEEALADYRAATDLREELVNRDGRNDLRHDLGVTYLNRGNALQRLGRLEEALAESGAPIGLYEELVRREGRSDLRNYLAMAYMHRGNELAGLGRLEQALSDHGAAIDLREELVRREGRRDLRDELALAYLNRGTTLRELGRLDEALSDYNAAISLYEELVRQEGCPELRHDLAEAYLNRGIALWRLDRLEEALCDYATCIGLEEELVHREGHRELAGDLAIEYAGHAGLLLRMGRRQEACQRAREAASILQREVTRTGRDDLRRALEYAEEVTRNACG